jgi:flagellar hook protein FlgE
VEVNALRQDGYPAGELTTLTIGDGGRLQGNYNNGQVVGIYQLSVAQFSNDNGLKRVDGGAFEQTIDSGVAVIQDPGRSMVGGAVENSNTDIADEFAKMIVTQQAYSANTKVISTSSDMLRDIINIVR